MTRSNARPLHRPRRKSAVSPCRNIQKRFAVTRERSRVPHPSPLALQFCEEPNIGVRRFRSISLRGCRRTHTRGDPRSTDQEKPVVSTTQHGQMAAGASISPVIDNTCARTARKKTHSRKRHSKAVETVTHVSGGNRGGNFVQCLFGQGDFDSSESFKRQQSHTRRKGKMGVRTSRVQDQTQRTAGFVHKKHSYVFQWRLGRGQHAT